MSTLGKRERLTMILALLVEAAPCRTAAEVRELLERVFDQVEDAHSGVPKNPDPMANQGGRMYPPHDDYLIDGSDPPTYRHRNGHRTTIAKNGSFRIKRIEANLDEQVIFEKRGADGKGYWE
jgi:hypothetical protein